MAERILEFHPRRRSPQAASARRSSVAWSLTKGDVRIDCVLDESAGDCRLCWIFNGQWAFRSEFPCSTEAVVAAALKHEELLASGWVVAGESARAERRGH